MKHLLIILWVVMFGLKTQAQGKIFSTRDGAINGYDPVAYFTDSAAVKGSPQYSFVWNDATWFFRSKTNLELFRNNPQLYAPQFGGFCAYGVSRNYKVKTEPDAWSIVEGKLYLNYNLEVQKKWLPDKETYIQKANNNWPDLEKKQ
jgi:YHS domain-containing protein